MNPKVKRLLRNIFKKTLAANINRRYQSTDELINDLDEAIEVVSVGKPYIVANCPVNTTAFVGRTEELAKINSSFKDKCRAVFLHGDGGIGKSSLAIAYANQYRKNYDVVLFLRYKDSLKNLLDEIEIENFEEDKSKIKKIHDLMDEHTLLVIDNFDVEIDQDEYLDELLKLKANIIFTTRTDFSCVYSGDIIQIEITKMPYEMLTQIFANASGIVVTDKQDVDTLHNLIKLVDYHTYATELLGKQMASSGVTLDELYGKISNGIDNLFDSEKIRTQKDGRVFKRTIPEIMRVLFNVADLNEQRKQVLRNMFLLRFVGITIENYRKFTNAKANEINAFNDMLELGWIRFDGINYNIHPLVQEIVKSDLTPNQENSTGVYQYIHKLIDECCEYEYGDDAEHYKYIHDEEFLRSFFDNVDLNNKYNLQLLLKWFNIIIENESTEMGSPIHSRFVSIYNKLEEMIDQSSVTCYEELDIRSFILAAWLREFRYHYLDKNISEHNEKLRIDNLYQAFDCATTSAKFLPDDDKEQALDKIYSLIFKMDTIILSKIPHKFILSIYNERPHTCELMFLDKERLNLPLTDGDQEEKRQFYEQYPRFKEDISNKQTESTLSEESKLICTYKNQFQESNDKVHFVKQIVEDETHSPLMRAKLIYSCIDTILGELRSTGLPYYFNMPTDWSSIEQMLDIEDEWLFSEQCRTSDSNNQRNWHCYYKYNLLNKLIVYAATNESTMFEINMILFETEMKYLNKQHMDNHCHWSHLAKPKFNIDMPFDFLINAMINIKKTSMLIPFLIRFVEGWEDYVERKSITNKKPLFSAYKTIVNCAMAALEEEDVQEEYKADFSAIAQKYRNKMKELAGVFYSFRAPNK